MRPTCVLVAALSLGCEAIAGYDTREPWTVASADGGDASADATITTDASDADTSTDAPEDTAVPCLAPKTRCGDACVDLTRDFDHCGACGARCPTSAVCTTDAAGTSCVCPGTQVVCGSGDAATCIDTSSDRDHCGACGRTCGAGEVCVGGACACGPDTTTCGGSCKDTRSDPQACGACDGACAATEYCAGSACKCRPGLVLCDGACVDTMSDPRNCGGCGNTCSASCRSGSCKPNCAGAGTSCPVGSGHACVDTKTDPQNCGGCGKACAANELCVAGACAAYAPAVGCASCPCDACGELFATAKCCPALVDQPAPICVAAAACP